MVQNVSKSLRRKVQGKWTYTKITPQSINLAKNLKQLGINFFQLVDMGLLIGTDYFSGIKGIGPKKALVYMQQHKQVEKVMYHLKHQYEFSSLTPEIISKVRNIFLFPEINTSSQDFYWNTPLKPHVIKLLCQDHHLNKERVENNLEKLVFHYHKCRRFFLKGIKTPKRIQQTLHKSYS